MALCPPNRTFSVCVCVGGGNVLHGERKEDLLSHSILAMHGERRPPPSPPYAHPTAPSARCYGGKSHHLCEQ
jgi:hypothetical protein